MDFENFLEVHRKTWLTWEWSW